MFPGSRLTAWPLQLRPAALGHGTRMPWQAARPMGGKAQSPTCIALPIRKGEAMAFQNRDFVQLVKRTREKFGVSIDEAHDLIFADEEMRRLVAWRINHDEECRKQALWDMRRKGDRSRFIRQGDRITFRDGDDKPRTSAGTRI
jgi:hypothetical protein